MAGRHQVFAQSSDDACRHSFLCDRHHGTLHFPVALIQRKLLMDFDELSLLVLNFLPKSKRNFARIGFFDVTARQPDRPGAPKR